MDPTKNDKDSSQIQTEEEGCAILLGGPEHAEIIALPEGETYETKRRYRDKDDGTPLEIRDTYKRGPMVRVYIHQSDGCRILDPEWEMDGIPAAERELRER